MNGVQCARAGAVTGIVLAFAVLKLSCGTNLEGDQRGATVGAAEEPEVPPPDLGTWSVTLHATMLNLPDHYWNGQKHAFTVDRDGSFSWDTSDYGFWHFSMGATTTSDFELNMKGSGSVRGKRLTLKLEFEEVSGKMVGRGGGRINHTQTLSRGDAQRTYWNWVNKDVQKTGQVPKSTISPVETDFLKPTSVVTEGDDVVVTYRTHPEFTVGAAKVTIEVVHRAKAADLAVFLEPTVGTELKDFPGETAIADGAIVEVEVWAMNKGPSFCPIANATVDFVRTPDLEFGRAELVSADPSNGYVDFAPGSSHLEWILKDGLQKDVPTNCRTKWRIRIDPSLASDADARQFVREAWNRLQKGKSFPAGSLHAHIENTGLYDPKLRNNNYDASVRVLPP